VTRGWPGAAIPSHPHFDLRWLSVIALCTAIGLASIAVANAGSRQDNDASYVFFWLGLLLIFVEQAAPAGNPVYRNVLVRFGSDATAPDKRRDLDDVTSPLELTREHLHVEVSPA
jgi:hypothetical protein